MKEYFCYGKVVGSKYLGTFKAVNKAKAIKKAEKNAWVGLCHQCSKECEDPEIIEIVAERIKK